MIAEFPVKLRLKALKANYIPPITDPMGKHWEQPHRDCVKLRGWRAFIGVVAFHRLHDYSCSEPSGVYAGKMWKSRVDYYDESKGWLLRWYGLSEKPETVLVHTRIILMPYDMEEKTLKNWGTPP